MVIVKDYVVSLSVLNFDFELITFVSIWNFCVNNKTLSLLLKLERLIKTRTICDVVQWTHGEHTFQSTTFENHFRDTPLYSSTPT
jgi:hypothetical protein